MVRLVILGMLLAVTRANAQPAIASDPAPVRTWLVNDESAGEMMAHGRWSYLGAGLGVTHTLFCHFELGIEGSALRLDAPDEDDPRHGFALRAGATLGYRFRVSHFADLDWGIEPHVGAATAAVYGLGADDRTQHEVFAGVRASFRAVIDHEPSQGFGIARGMGAHVTLRVARSQGELAASFLLGYDWGL
jgi:hypothetical protein